MYLRQGFLVGIQLPLFAYAFYQYFDPNKYLEKSFSIVAYTLALLLSLMLFTGNIYIRGLILGPEHQASFHLKHEIKGTRVQLVFISIGVLMIIGMYSQIEGVRINYWNISLYLIIASLFGHWTQIFYKNVWPCCIDYA